MLDQDEDDMMIGSDDRRDNNNIGDYDIDDKKFSLIEYELAISNHHQQQSIIEPSKMLEDENFVNYRQSFKSSSIRQSKQKNDEEEDHGGDGDERERIHDDVVCDVKNIPFSDLNADFKNLPELDMP
mmetsp:Transcript_13965/g.9849  ORF Transcript_13965/g.9849 Transcript_13965/m.9849 type:complete len:127 (-) Transcript_13965:12-392(-)|eukprot:CAMPEP_0116875670 /NCGR_PEP_ID=MMETSP0463-20121206/7714_1 /TAXON_ID=181622 /ORGANISM="Strombidinopsis sp, Strain SopsisLIS2011" /LENGTH=126 /DNA_ID=CAMNT_0004521711 /DNA_START=343 /DNA_END=723 /DNA_ORIENTATION=+